MKPNAAAMIAVFLLTIAAQDKTTQDGVYTEAQANRGLAVYGKSCASCHAPNLEGDGQAPPLAGKEFEEEWKDAPLSDLFERIRVTMPGDAPGTLKPPEVADVMAYLFSRAKFPTGPTALPDDVPALKAIAYRAPAR
jgi:S-disulfanyl-L-cysteine oxidoreductase SoxD